MAAPSRRSWPGPVESVETLVPMRPARFTVDLLSRVPLTPMRQAIDVVKMGQQIAVIDARFLSVDRVVARASSLMISDGAQLEFPPGSNLPPELPLPPIEEMPLPAMGGFSFPGFWNAMDYVRTRGETAGGAPASVSRRLPCSTTEAWSREPSRPSTLPRVAWR